MSDVVGERATGLEDAAVIERLSSLDRFLPVLIIAAMVLGLVLGRLVSGLDGALATVEIRSVSLPIAIGLLVMMYPVLAKVRYDELGHVTADKRLLVASVFLNWVLGPPLMFALPWLTARSGYPPRTTRTTRFTTAPDELLHGRRSPSTHGVEYKRHARPTCSPRS
jgi:ACR3 family arsenite transporter